MVYKANQSFFYIEISSLPHKPKRYSRLLSLSTKQNYYQKVHTILFVTNSKCTKLNFKVHVPKTLITLYKLTSNKIKFEKSNPVRATQRGKAHKHE